MHGLDHLPPDQVDIVVNTLTEWCRARHIAIPSEQWRAAIGVAVDLLGSKYEGDLRTDLRAALAKRLN